MPKLMCVPRQDPLRALHATREMDIRLYDRMGARVTRSLRCTPLLRGGCTLIRVRLESCAALLSELIPNAYCAIDTSAPISSPSCASLCPYRHRRRPSCRQGRLVFLASAAALAIALAARLAVAISRSGAAHPAYAADDLCELFDELRFGGERERPTLPSPLVISSAACLSAALRLALRGCFATSRACSSAGRRFAREEGATRRYACREAPEGCLEGP